MSFADDLRAAKANLTLGPIENLHLLGMPRSACELLTLREVAELIQSRRFSVEITETQVILRQLPPPTKAKEST